MLFTPNVLTSYLTLCKFYLFIFKNEAPGRQVLLDSCFMKQFSFTNNLLIKHHANDGDDGGGGDISAMPHLFHSSVGENI